MSAIAASDFFVGTDGERVVGFSEYDPETRELAAVYVHPDFERRGLGRALLEAAEAAAHARGVDSLHLRASLNAVSFYQRAGYVVERAGSVTLRSGSELRCVFMRKTLR